MVEQLGRKIYLYNNMIKEMREQLRSEISREEAEDQAS